MVEDCCLLTVPWASPWLNHQCNCNVMCKSAFLEEIRKSTWGKKYIATIAIAATICCYTCISYHVVLLKCMTMLWKKGSSMKSTRFGRKTHLSCMTWWWRMRWSGPALLSSGFQMSAGIYMVSIIQRGLNPNSNTNNRCLSSCFFTANQCPVLRAALHHLQTGQSPSS